MINNMIQTLMKKPLVARFVEDVYCKIPYYFMKGKAFNPLAVVLLVSYKCNLRCRMCFYYNDSEKENTNRLIKDRQKEELTLDQIKRLIEDIRDMKAKVLTIHGGEPLLYPKIFEIADYARKKGLLVNFVTNGTLITPEVAEKIVRVGICNITFSIDGPESIHDKVRNVKGTFDKLIKGIGHLKELEKKGAKIPNLSLSTYISAINQEKLVELFEVIKDLGIKNWGSGLITYNNAKLARSTEKILGCSESHGQGNLENLEDEVKNLKIETLLQQREKIKQKNKVYKLNVLFPSKNSIKNYYDSFYNEIDYCLYPWARTVVSPYGEVFPCINLSMLNYSLGSIKENSIKDIWNSERYVAFRKILRKNKLLPICSKCCTISKIEKI